MINMHHRLVSLFMILLSVSACAMPAASPADTNRFERLYEEGCRFANSESVRFSADFFFKVRDSDAFRELSKMGTKAIPLLAGRILRNDNQSEASAIRSNLDGLFEFHLWCEITRLSHVVQDNPWADDSLATSWKGGRELAEQRIRFLLSEMRIAEKERREIDFSRAQTAIVSQGVFAVEPLFDVLEYGAEDVVAVLSEFSWIREECPSATRDELLAWWQENKERFSLPEKQHGFRVEPHFEKWERLGK